jgi:uncharacterized protein (DUF2252 family)
MLASRSVARRTSRRVARRRQPDPAHSARQEGVMTSTKSTSPTKPRAGAGKTPTQPVRQLTVAERAAKGKSARAEVPRRAHEVWETSPGRPDPVSLLEEQAKARVAELVPIRYGRMLVSPFSFFRGAAYIMASDLAGLPRTGLHVQLCGDAHLSNFGSYAAPDRRLVFDINDFDETLRGPFEWDLKRLAASFAVAGRSRGFDPKRRRAINETVGRSYRAAIADLAAMRTLDVWYSRVDVDETAREWSSQASAKAVKRFERNVAKARTKDSLSALAKLTRIVDGERRFVSNPPLVVPLTELVPETAEQVFEATRAMIRSYRRTLEDDRRQLLERFRFVDAARKVVGVGSVGTRAWIALFVGRDNDDPLILQIKEAQGSVLEPFLAKSEFSNSGQRVVAGQRLMQAASDMMLGWIRTAGIDGIERDFYIRQLWDSKGSALVDVMKPPTMALYAKVCAQTLARAHARSGDAVAISGYLGSSSTFDRALAAFAEAYADQNERDYEALKTAADSGRIPVESGL